MKKFVFTIFLLLVIGKVFCLEEKKTNEYVISMEKGTPIYAIDDGDFITSGYDFNLGTYIEVNYKSLGLIVRYCNMSKVKFVQNGKIKKGDKLGESGLSGEIYKPGLTIIITVQEPFYLQK